MDKFGIFELLDTLAQISSDAAPEEKKTDEAPIPRVSPDDKSFLPPDFNGTNESDEKRAQRSALNSLYERHESISKRIDKKK